MKYILAGGIGTLGIIQLADWNAEKPQIGIPITIVLVIAWAVEIIKTTNEKRR
jgi:hypothetical protein